MDNLTPEALKALSEAADPGPWTRNESDMLAVSGYWFGECGASSTAAYIVALVNAHRAGLLVHVDAEGGGDE